MKHFYTELVPCRRVQLSDTFDIYCLVDERDYEWAQQWRWNFNWQPKNPLSLYARRNIGDTRTTLYLHRELLLHVSDLPMRYTDSRVVDHVNGQTLDCRRANLRWATERENRRNRVPRHSVPSLEHLFGLCPTPAWDLPF